MRIALLLIALLAGACGETEGRFYDNRTYWIATDTGVTVLNQRRAVLATPSSQADELTVKFLDQPIDALQRCGDYHYALATNHNSVEIWDSAGARRSLPLTNRVSRMHCSPSGKWLAAYASSDDTLANAGTVAGLNQLTLISAQASFADDGSAPITLSVPDEPLYIVFREGDQPQLNPMVVVVGLSRLSMYNLSSLNQRRDATPLAMIPLTVDGEDPGLIAEPILSASGQRLYLRTRTYGELLRVDLPPLTPRVSLVADTRGAAAITPISDPTALAILRADHSLVLLDEDTEQTRVLADSLDATSATILPGEASSDVSALVVLTHGRAPTVYAVDLTQTHVTPVRLSADYSTSYLSPDRRFVVFHHPASDYGNSLLTIWDTRTAIPRELSVPAGPLLIGFHPRHASMVMVAVDSARLYVIDLATGAVGAEPYDLTVPADPDPDVADELEPITVTAQTMGTVGDYGLFIGSAYPLGAVFFLPYGDTFVPDDIVSLAYLHLYNLLDTDEPAPAANSGR